MASHLTVSEGRELTLGRERRTQQPLATDSGPHALLVVGGDTSSVLSFELSSGRWQSAAALPAARMGAGVAVLDGRVYVVGGWDGRSIVKTVFMYDVARGSWSSRPSLTTSRRRLAAATLDGVLYAVGGMNSGGAVLSSVEAFDPREGVWRSISSMRTERVGLGVAALDGRLYAVGGENYMIGFLNTVERYDPWSARWETVDSMSKRRADAAVCVVDDVLYAAGGQNWPITYRSVERYRAGSGWEPAPSMITARCRAAVATHNGRLYVAGGVDDHYVDLSSVAVFSPSSAAWSKLPTDMPEGRTDARAVVVHCQPHGEKNTQKSGRSVDNKQASNRSSGPRAAVSTSHIPLAVGDCNKNAEVIPDVSSYERSSGSSQAAAVTVLDDRSFKGAGPQPAPSGSKLPEVESQNEVNFNQCDDTSLQEELMFIRKKTFTKWINSFLERDRMDVNDLFVDLADGRQLHKLLEIISGERLPRLNSGQMKIHKIENVKRCIKFLSSKVRLESIDAEGIVNGNPVQILNLIWTIIQRFQIQEIEVNVNEDNERSKKKYSGEALLLWCQRKTSGYQGVNIKNFSNSWSSGLGFNALIHAHRPDLFNWIEVPTADNEDVLNHAFDVAHERLSVPRLLDAEDVDISVPDEESIMTYLACYYHTFTSTKNEQTSGRSVDSELAPSSEPRALSGGAECHPQKHFAAVSTPHALLVVGGSGKDKGKSTPDVFLYELSSRLWQSAAALPTRRSDAGIAVLDGRVYVVGGYEDGWSTTTVVVYDVARGSWSSGPSLTRSRCQLAAATLNGLLYAVGGADGRALSSAEAFDPREGVWRSIVSMSTCRSALGVGVLHGRLYAAGGQDNSNGPLNTVERYDPSSARWEAVDSMSERRWAVAVGVVDDVLYAAGGYNWSTTVSSVERYRAGSGWEPAPSMITERQGAAVATHAGRLYVVGGEDHRGDVLSSVEVFSPSSAAWSELPAAMPEGRLDAAAVVVSWPPMAHARSCSIN